MWTIMRPCQGLIIVHIFSHWRLSSQQLQQPFRTAARPHNFSHRFLQFSWLGLIQHSPGYLPNKLHLNAGNNGTPDHDWWASLWTFQSWNPLGRALCRYFWTASIILLFAPGFGKDTVFGGLDLMDLVDWCIESRYSEILLRWHNLQSPLPKQTLPFEPFSI